jgi:hypothetical protein
VVTRIEYATEPKGIALGAFPDIEEAFDRTSFDTIKQAAIRHDTEPAICRWICAMMESRNISATLSGEALRVSVARGCPQGGVLSPLLWTLVVDDLWGLNSNGYYTTGYSDDISNSNQWEIPSHCLRSLTNSPEHSPKVMRKDNHVYQSKQDGNYTFY